MASGPSVLKGSNHPRWFAPLGAVLVLGGLLGAFAGYDAMRSEPMNAKVAYGGLGTLAFALLAVFAVSAFTKREITVDGEGIDVRTRGGKTMHIDWSEPHDFYYRGIVASGMPTVEKVTLTTEDGRRIDVDSVSVQGNPNACVPKVIEQYSTAAMWPKIQARLAAGEEVRFGAVTMSREKIKIGPLTHSLEKRVTLQIEAGKLKIGTEGKWLQSEVGVSDVANYPSLLKAIGQVSQALPPG
jgi:hypothetical protein